VLEFGTEKPINSRAPSGRHGRLAAQVDIFRDRCYAGAMYRRSGIDTPGSTPTWRDANERLRETEETCDLLDSDRGQPERPIGATVLVLLSRSGPDSGKIGSARQ